MVMKGVSFSSVEALEDKGGADVVEKRLVILVPQC